MQITFDTSNPKDLAILDQVLALALGGKAQPAVAQNTGTTATGLDLSPEGSGVDESAAPAVAPVTEKPKRTKKAVEPAPEETLKNVPAPEGTKPEYNLDHARAALQLFTSAKGVPAGIELLKKYGAGRISELDTSNYAAFIAECEV